MKRGLVLLLISVSFCMPGCKKDTVKNKPVEIGTTASDSYFPVTTGSTWRYQDGSSFFDITITDTTTVFDGKAYINASSYDLAHSRLYEEYFYAGDHLFATKFTPFENGHFDLQVLNDTMAVGHSWTAPPAYEGLIYQIKATCTTTIKEKGISMTIYGATFTNVVHTQVDMRYFVNNAYDELGKYDFYFAKGVGIVKSTCSINGETREIRSYNIK